MQYNSLILKQKREKSILNRHPWIFSGGVAKVNANDGDIVEVVSHGGEKLGFGFYSSKSQIVCRMFEWGRDEYDFETADYWIAKFKRAFDLRSSCLDFNQTNCYRLLHAEGDFLPGVIVDVYNDVAVAQVLIKAIELRKELIKEAILACGVKHIYVKSKVSSHKLEDIEVNSQWLTEERAVPVTVLENGVKFDVDFIEGQKTGFFIDQRDNRQLVKELSNGKDVLNTFSYTGGFSVYALAGGANKVDSVDLSQLAVDMAERNAQLNFPEGNHRAIAEDCFQFLTNMEKDEYDLIILDPPAFAKHKRAVENASRGYKQINMKAFKKIRPGGILFTFSCSQNISKDLFQKIVFSAAADARRNVRIIHQLHQPFDHPINIFHPEGEYLKGLALYVE